MRAMVLAICARSSASSSERACQASKQRLSCRLPSRLSAPRITSDSSVFSTHVRSASDCLRYTRCASARKAGSGGA